MWHQLNLIIYTILILLPQNLRSISFLTLPPLQNPPLPPREWLNTQKRMTTSNPASNKSNTMAMTLLLQIYPPTTAILDMYLSSIPPPTLTKISFTHSFGDSSLLPPTPTMVTNLGLFDVASINFC